MKTISAVVVAMAVCLMAPQAKAECGSRAADIIFVLDGSSSIYPLNFDKVVDFVRETVRHFQISPTETRVGLVTFSNHVQVRFTPASYSTKTAILNRGLARVTQPTGDTRTDRALERVRRLFSTHGRTDIPKIAVIITDGGSDYPAETVAQATLAHNEGIVTFAIGIGSQVVQSELAAVASSSAYVHTVENFDGLSTIQALLALQACTAENLVPELTTEIDAPTTEAPLPPLDLTDCVHRPADLVFVADASGSIHPDDFQLQLNFISDVVGAFEISNTSVRVGVMTYGTNVTTNVDLHNHQQKLALQRAVSRIVQRRGVTNTDLALKHMRTHYFEQHRSRGQAGHAKIAVVITDGISEDAAATLEEAQLAREEGVTLFAVGVGEFANYAELNGIASRPTADHVFTVSSYSALQHIKAALMAKTCTVSINVPTIDAPSTTTTATIAATTTTSTTKAPPTTEELMQADKPAECLGGPVDIVFALPADLDTANTAHSLNFIRSLTYSITVGHGAVHIGLLPKDCYSNPGFHLSEGHDLQGLRGALDVNRFTTSNTAALIRHVRQDSFRFDNGGRPGAKRMAVLIVNKASYDVSEAQVEAQMARQDEDIEIFVIAVGGAVPEVELKVLSSKPHSKHVLHVAEFCDLLSINLQLVRRLCLQGHQDNLLLPDAN